MVVTGLPLIAPIDIQQCLMPVCSYEHYYRPVKHTLWQLHFPKYLTLQIIYSMNCAWYILIILSWASTYENLTFHSLWNIMSYDNPMKCNHENVMNISLLYDKCMNECNDNAIKTTWIKVLKWLWNNDEN